MKRLLLASAASLFAIGAISAAQAQSKATTGDSTATSPAVNGGAPATPGTVPPASSSTAPGSQALGAPGANSQTGTTQPDAPVATTAAATDQGPHKGANSFTEGQAQGRITDAGYTSVAGLKKDSDGIWRGNAMKNGQQVGVWLDYTGNVGQS